MDKSLKEKEKTIKEEILCPLARFLRRNPSCCCCSREWPWLLVSVGIVLVPVRPVRGVYWCCSNKWSYLLSTRSLHSQHSHRQDRKHKTRFVSEHSTQWTLDNLQFTLNTVQLTPDWDHWLRPVEYKMIHMKSYDWIGLEIRPYFSGSLVVSSC